MFSSLNIFIWCFLHCESCTMYNVVNGKINLEHWFEKKKKYDKNKANTHTIRLGTKHTGTWCCQTNSQRKKYARLSLIFIFVAIWQHHVAMFFVPKRMVWVWTRKRMNFSSILSHQSAHNALASQVNMFVCLCIAKLPYTALHRHTKLGN